MLQELSNLVVADNTGAKRAMCFRILKQRKEYAHLGDVIRVAIKEASPTGSIRKGQVATAVIIRTGNQIRREDGQRLHFDQNACVLVDAKMNPIGSRVFGPVPRELRDKSYKGQYFTKIVSMAPEVV
ncbi:MAG: 50S ribosomal protein L14 [Kiritimatiellia bacterium]